VVFFFQAEDGIRDFHVTGVQTCALPIWGRRFIPGSKTDLHRSAFFPGIVRTIIGEGKAKGFLVKGLAGRHISGLHFYIIGRDPGHASGSSLLACLVSWFVPSRHIMTACKQKAVTAIPA